jgi:hypothetical protein
MSSCDSQQDMISLEGTYKEVMNQIHEILYDIYHEKGEKVCNHSANTPAEVAEEEVEEIEVNHYCNYCGVEWTEEEQENLGFVFYSCGHGFHKKCFSNYLFHLKDRFQLQWKENTASHCEVELQIISRAPISSNSCYICKDFEALKESRVNMMLTPDLKTQVIYRGNVFGNSEEYNFEKIERGMENVIYFREEDIDNLEKQFQLGQLICFVEAPFELYILDLDMLSKPCFKKCEDNRIPFKFVQMHGYRYYINSIYSSLITYLALDNEEKEYWNWKSGEVTRMEDYDYEIEEIPEVEELAYDGEIGSLEIENRREKILNIQSPDKVWIQLQNVNDYIIIPQQYVRLKGYEYYFEWYLLNQFPIYILVSTFELMDIANKEIIVLPAELLNID